MQEETSYPKDGGDSIRVQHPSQQGVVQIHEVLLVDDYHLDPPLRHTVSTAQLACNTPSQAQHMPQISKHVSAKNGTADEGRLGDGGVGLRNNPCLKQKCKEEN